mmetsp:Transcript_35565/g.77168  ORF Transcript_35565/g.77168 Transcript_35565/m.77168 type:complete len:287 (-) Transcript_35565:850-1710(-)
MIGNHEHIHKFNDVGMIEGLQDGSFGLNRLVGHLQLHGRHPSSAGRSGDDLDGILLPRSTIDAATDLAARSGAKHVPYVVVILHSTLPRLLLLLLCLLLLLLPLPKYRLFQSSLFLQLLVLLLAQPFPTVSLPHYRREELPTSTTGTTTPIITQRRRRRGHSGPIRLVLTRLAGLDLRNVHHTPSPLGGAAARRCVGSSSCRRCCCCTLSAGGCRCIAAAAASTNTNTNSATASASASTSTSTSTSPTGTNLLLLREDIDKDERIMPNQIILLLLTPNSPPQRRRI